MTAKPVSHYLDVYDVWLHYAGNQEAWTKLRRKNDALEETPDGWGLTHSTHDDETSKMHIHIWVNEERHADDEGELINTVAHEATHAATDIFNAINQEIRGDEPLAYLVAWITRWAWKNATRT